GGRQDECPASDGDDAPAQQGDRGDGQGGARAGPDRRVQFDQRRRRVVGAAGGEEEVMPHSPLSPRQRGEGLGVRGTVFGPTLTAGPLTPGPSPPKRGE